MSKLSPARRFALDVLADASSSQAFVRDALAARKAAASTALDERDFAFSSTLALGVTATSGCLDEALDTYLAKPRKLSARVRIALRIATFEMLYLNTPGHIAVSQGVELVRSQARSAAGLANAVLRRIDANRDSYLKALDVPEGERAVSQTARALGLPVWLYREIARAREDRGCNFELVDNLNPAPLAVHLNPLCSCKATLNQQTIPSVLPGCLLVTSPHVLASSERREGELVVSDLHAQLIASIATRAGSCLEIGSGRGTKTFVMTAQAARFGLERQHVALDLHAHKAQLNRERMDAAGLGEHIEYLSGNACDLDAALQPLDCQHKHVCFDTVFVDAPCSGVGTMRRHPEIPWRLSELDVQETLPQLQLTMLTQAARRVVPGGELIYSTCSPLLKEDDEVIAQFLASPEGSLFAVAPVSGAEFLQRKECADACAYVKDHETPEGYFAPMPVAHTDFDGHFCARFVRTN